MPFARENERVGRSAGAMVFEVFVAMRERNVEPDPRDVNGGTGASV
jgi:hypothetical protein